MVLQQLIFLSEFNADICNRRCETGHDDRYADAANPMKNLMRENKDAQAEIDEG